MVLADTHESLRRAWRGCAGLRPGVAILACIGLLLAASSEAAASGPFELSGPTSLILGKDRSAKIRAKIRANAGAGKTAPRLYASVGTVSAFRKQGGELVATYRPPKTRYPQVAIIAAVSRDLAEIDFIPILLLGRPTIRIASEPKASVLVRVGSRDFGPIRVGRSGRGAVRALVPPGVSDATIISSDALGNTRRTPHPLGVPPFQRVLALCPQGGDTAFVIAVEPDGTPSKRARFVQTASTGSLGRAKRVRPGLFSSRFRVGNVELKSETATLAFAHSKKGPRSSCTAQIPKESPTAISATPSATAVTPATLGTLALRVSYSYPGRRAPRHEAPDVKVDIGSATVREDGEGQYSIAWTIPKNYSNKKNATATITHLDTGLSESVRVALLPGPTAQLELTPKRRRLTASKDSQTTIEVAAYDEHGNRREVRISAAATRGKAEAGANGATVLYRAPQLFHAARDSISVRTSDGYEDTVWLDLAPSSRSVFASARVGFASNGGILQGAALGVDASVHLPLWSKRLALGVESGLLRGGQSLDRSDGMERVSTSMSVVPLLLRATARHRMGDIDVFAGPTAGVLFGRADVKSERSGMRSEVGRDLAYGGLLGARMRLGRGLLVAETSYLVAHFDEPGVMGSIGGIRLTGGYAFDL